MLNSALSYKIQKRDNFFCQYCGKDGLRSLEDWHNTVVDHFDPSGGDKEDNLVTACHYCNAIKGDKKFNNIEETKRFIRERRITLEKNYSNVYKEIRRGNSITSKIFVPTKGPLDWKQLLASPEAHWKTGKSAQALAYCWQEAQKSEDKFPLSIKMAFKKSGIEFFKNIKLLLAIPEYKVPLEGGGRPSQNDIFVLCKSNTDLIVIMVEGKVDEPFGGPVSEWKLNKDEETNKPERLDYLLTILNLKGKSVEHIYYQLLHRTASAIIEAKKFNANHALMLIHSFSQTYEHFEAYTQFLALYELAGIKDSIIGPVVVNRINLFFGWVKGEKEYLII